MLPYDDASFDVVLCQFGHMFAPRPEVATKEMLRVLKPGGTIAFSTWPPELALGRIFALVGKHSPPLPAGASPAPQWGDVGIVRQRLGEAVRDLTFDRETMLVPALSPGHYRVLFETTSGPVPQARPEPAFGSEQARTVPRRRGGDHRSVLRLRTQLRPARSPSDASRQIVTSLHTTRTGSFATAAMRSIARACCRRSWSVSGSPLRSARRSLRMSVTGSGLWR